jgi:hypothetical protein
MVMLARIHISRDTAEEELDLNRENEGRSKATSGAVLGTSFSQFHPAVLDTARRWKTSSSEWIIRAVVAVNHTRGNYCIFACRASLACFCQTLFPKSNTRKLHRGMIERDSSCYIKMSLMFE